MLTSPIRELALMRSGFRRRHPLVSRRGAAS